MLRSTRAALAVGLGCIGVAGLVGQSVAQQGDGGVKRVATGNSGTGGTAPAATMPAVSIGTIDVEGAFRAYDKVTVRGEDLNAEVQLRYMELTKLATEGKQQQEKLGHMAPGSADAQKCEQAMVSIKAQIEAGRQNAEREFTQKETETMTGIYNEVAEMATRVAQSKGMTFVVKYNEGKVQSTEPNSAMSAMSKTFIYADPRVDITKEVVAYLNQHYKVTGGRAPKTPNPAAGAPGAGAAPAGRPAPAPRTATAPAGR